MSENNIVRLLRASNDNPRENSASVTLTIGDLNQTHTTRGATGAVTFTLPSASGCKGKRATFINVVDQDMIVASADEETLSVNDLTADSVAASTTNEQIGAVIEAYCDGTVWIVWGAAVGHTYTVASA